MRQEIGAETEKIEWICEHTRKYFHNVMSTQTIQDLQKLLCKGEYYNLSSKKSNTVKPGIDILKYMLVILPFTGTGNMDSPMKIMYVYLISNLLLHLVNDRLHVRLVIQVAIQQ